MILCKNCQFMLNNRCRLNPPQMITYYTYPENRAPNQGEFPAFYTQHSAEYPNVEDPGHGCFRGKLIGTFQQELL